MKLLLDIGNSRLKWATLCSGRFHAGGAVSHGDELPAEWDRLPHPATVLAVSVAQPVLWDRLESWSSARWGVVPRCLVTPAEGGGIRVAYPAAETLGADRWAAMVGARAAGLLPACIVDCGTAVTVDVVDAAGRHLGGLIAPGVGTMRRSLAVTAHHLPEVGQGRVDVLSRDTPGAIRGGTLLGCAAMVEGLADRVVAATGGALNRIITGGDSECVLPHLAPGFLHLPHLVLEGLAALAEESP